MDPQDIVRTLPLVTAGLFYAVVAVQVLRNRVRTWTESFFVLFFFLGGTYALCDFLFLRSTSPEEALLFSRVGESSLTLSVVCLFLFTQVFFRRMKKGYLAHFVPALAFIGVTWVTRMPEVVRMPWGWDVHYHAASDLGWTMYILAYAAASLWNLRRTYVITLAHNRSLGRRIQAVVLGFLLCIVAGLASYVIEETGLPVFTSAMTALGLTALLLSSPATWRSLLDTARRWGRGRYSIEAVYLMYADGTLIGSKFAGSQDGADSDLFLATLDTIQNFMRVSFPAAGGKWLRVLEQGDVRIVIERGALASLVLVVKGEEDEFLRRQMKETLGAYETLNRDILAKWKGVARDATGTERFLDLFFARETFF